MFRIMRIVGQKSAPPPHAGSGQVPLGEGTWEGHGVGRVRLFFQKFHQLSFLDDQKHGQWNA